MRWLTWLAVAVCAWLGTGPASAAHVLPADDAPASVASVTLTPPPAADRFTVGTLRIQRHGGQGTPVILIPGLECGPWEWAQTIEQLQGRHRVYAVTLAGFDGVPAPAPDAKAGNLLDRADASLLRLIKSRHLDKPLLIGHSLGGTLALRFAGEHASLISGVVAVDGLPVYPFMDQMTREQRQHMAQRMKSRMEGLTADQFKAFALRYMQGMGVIDPALAARAARRTARSDPKASAEYMAEDMSADYRDGLKRAAVPILEISPYNEPDFKQAARRSGRPFISEDAKTAYYRKMLTNAPDANVVSISPARHFVMLDQPRQFRRALDRFLGSLQQGGP